MALEVEMRVVEEDARRTYDAIGSILQELMEEGKVEKTPRVRELLRDLSTLVVYALGTRKYRQGEQN